MLHMIKIVSDSSMDMPPGWDEKYQINILPINIQFGNQSFRQGLDINAEKFYQLINELKTIPHTSLPSPSQIVDFYRNIAKRGESIISLHVASKMSGTYNAVKLAAQELAGELAIYPFDSGNGSAGLAYMCREARILALRGASIKDIINHLEWIREKITIVFALDSLEFARMNGRVSALQEKIVSLLQIKPIIMLKDGLLDMADKVRTRRKSIDRIIELVKKKIGEEKVNIAIVHAQDFDTAKILLDKAKEKLNIKEYIVTDLSISVAANLGPGTVGIVAYPSQLED